MPLFSHGWRLSYLNFVYALLSFDRRKSKQAMRDYKKVQIQLENLETSVRDRCKKEFTGTIQRRLLLNFTKWHQLSNCPESKKMHKVRRSFPPPSFRPDDRDDGHVQ